MKTNRTPIRAVGARARRGRGRDCVAVGGAVRVGAAPASQGVPDDQVGSWPRMAADAASDRLRSAGRTTRGFPSSLGADGATAASTTTVVSRDEMHVTHRTKTILGVSATVVHDVVLRHGKRARGHQRLVRPGSRRQRLVLRREHARAQPARPGDQSRGLVQSRPRRRASRGALPRRARGWAKQRARSTTRDTRRISFKILDLDARVSTPYVSTRHAVRTKETSPLEPGVVDNKYYARGVGDVKEVTVKGPKERLHLVSFHRG